MEPSPFFSILLPTKNRSEILGEAIQSVLGQSFQDFELIVSDNDDSPTATRETVSIFKDARIKYYRTTGNLPMHENWDNAFSHANGKHALILEDKMRLVPNALEVLHGLLKLHGDVVISYDVKFAKGDSIPSPPDNPAARFIASEEIIRQFCNFHQSFFSIIPKGLDSCAPMPLLRKIKKTSPTGLLFSHISPDYASGFMILAQVERILFLPENLIFIPNNWMWQGKYSNGQSNYKKGESIKRFYRELPVKQEEVLALVPVKCIYLWINAIIYDYYSKYLPKEKQQPINWARYFAFCWVLVLMGKKVGGDMSEDVMEINKALKPYSLRFKFQVALNFSSRALQLAWKAFKSKLTR